MRKMETLAAAGLTIAALLASGCGASDHESQSDAGSVGPQIYYPYDYRPVEPGKGLHVGSRGKWLKAEANGKSRVCILTRGAQLVIKNGDVTYHYPQAGGTDCPDGSSLDMTVAEAKAQTREFKAALHRQNQIARQISAMDPGAGKPIKIHDNWAELVNPTSVQQEYSNAIVQEGYGDTCFVHGETTEIGHLATGEGVVLVTDAPDRGGTTCPTGALFLETGNSPVIPR